MTVSELIEFLKTQPQDLTVAIDKYSDYELLTQDDIIVDDHCEPRPDGWIESGKRKGKPFRTYLVFEKLY